MQPIDIHKNIRIERDAGFQKQLKSGDFVYISVIKKLAPQKWAIGIYGRTISAYSDLELKTGDIIRARVHSEGGKITLHLTDNENTASMGKAAALGITDDPLSQVIIGGLLKGGISINEAVVGKLRHLLKELKREDRRIISLLVQIMKKGISLENARLAELVSILDYGEQKQGGREKQKKRETPPETREIKRVLKEAVTRTSGDTDNVLPLFNHLYAEGENWIIVPFAYTLDGTALEGSIRMRYDRYMGGVDRLAVIVRADRSARWSFLLDTHDKPFTLKVYCDRTENLPVLDLKLDNNGVKVDDTIHVDENYDGFSSMDEINYKSIDTLR
jgi:hypothetical protein